MEYIWFVKMSLYTTTIYGEVNQRPLNAMGCRWFSQILPFQIIEVKKMRFVGLSDGQRVNVALVWISMLHSSNMDRVRKTRGEGDDLERSNCRWVVQQLTILTILASSFNNTVTFVKNNGQSLGQYSSVLPTVWSLHLSGQSISQIYFSKILLRISDENYIRLFCWI